MFTLEYLNVEEDDRAGAELEAATIDGCFDYLKISFDAPGVVQK